MYIFDNSPSNGSYADKISNSFRYNFSGENRGLSRAFNYFLEESLADNLDYLLILDQDSLYKLDQLEQLIKDIASQDPDENVAIHTCRIVPQHLAGCVQPENKVVEIETVISSGSFINLHTVKKHGLSYDERIFVDYVDCDFCKVARRKGLKILCHTQYVISQQLGYYYNGRICHSTIRHYYMVRDLGYFNQKYYSLPVTHLKSLINLLRDIIISFSEDRTLEKLRFAFLGYFHCLQGRHGEFSSK